MKRSKVWLLALSAILCLTVLAVGCNKSQGGTAGLQSVTIVNKTELAADWYIGGDARTVQVTLSPDSYTTENTDVMVGSSDIGVVSVDGMTLRPVGAGTATVTVTAGTKTDSVDITVKPVLTGIAITNKAALASAWVTGEADRTVEFALAPDAFTEANTTVTVRSSDPAVVSVSGKTLTAVAIGTTTITVQAGEFTDTVEVGVRPPLESLTVTNKADLAADWVLGSGDRTVEVALTPVEYYTPDNTEITITSSTDAIRVEGRTLKAVGLADSTTITVSVKGQTETFTVATLLGDPVVTLTGDVSDDTIKLVEGDTVSLQATAATCDGTDLTADMSTTLSDTDNMTLSLNSLTVSKQGTYTITYEVADPRDDTKATTKELTVNVYRKIFSQMGNNFSVTDALKPDAEQEVTNSNNGFSSAQFNIAPSKLYYAEVTFDMPGTPGQDKVGMGHFVQGNTRRWLASDINRGNDKNHYIKDFNTDAMSAWSLDTTGEYYSFYSWQIDRYRGITDSTSNHVKYAVARQGDYFYTFVNDEYVAGTSLEYYREQDTLPGIFGFNLAPWTMSNIAFVAGTEAQTKIDALLAGSKIITSYVPNQWYTIPTGVQNGEITPEKGVNLEFTNSNAGFNGSVLSPYMYFDKNFTVEWEYEMSAQGSGTSRMLLEIRNSDYGPELLQLGARFSSNQFLLDAPQKPEAEKWYQPNLENATKVKFKVSRVLTDTYAEYTMTATNMDDPTKTYTRTIFWGQDDLASWKQPVLFLWHNENVSGKYSNIRWRVDEPGTTGLQSVSITNKDALTATWNLEDADRTVEVAFAPDLYNTANIPMTVTSSDTDVITVTGKKLSAVGAGTATITVTAGNRTDSVDITVTAALTGITIANKAELAATWLTTEPDREVEVLLTPEGYFTPANTEVTVTSSAPGVVSVNGMILQPVAQGTATITVTAGTFSDTVEVTVVPPLESLTVTNKTELSADFTIGGAGRTIEVALAPDDYYTPDNTEITVTSSAPDAIRVDGMTLTAVGLADSVTITVSAKGQSDTFTVKTVLGDPVITLTGNITNDTVEVLQGAEFALTAAAATCDGTDLTEAMSTTLSDTDSMTLTEGKLTVSVPGDYTITYAVADSRDNTLTAEKVLTVKVYRKIFGDTDGAFHVTDEMKANAEQQVTNTNNGFTSAKFNIAPSKLYYAEIKFDSEDEQTNANQIGLAHFTADNRSRYLVSTVARGNMDHKVKDFDTSTGWSLDTTGSCYALYSYQLGNNRKVNDTDSKHFKYAVARAGDYFYTFVNDEYVDCVTFEYYRNNDTLPGIFGHKLNNGWTMSNIVYVAGDEAQAKLDALLAGSKQITAYAPDTWASGSTDRTNYTGGEISDEKGVNVTFNKNNAGFNDSMISPYMYFDKNFTLEWEYEMKSYNESAGQPRMLLEVRDWKYGSEIVQFGADYKTKKFLLNTPQKPESEKWFEREFGTATKMKFTISRVVTDTYAEFTMTASDANDPTNTATRTIQWNADNKDTWNQPVLFLWHNTDVSGEYTNIHWTVD